GILSYTMPMSWNTDDIFWNIRIGPPSTGHPSPGSGLPRGPETLNRGIGQTWVPGGFPMWIRATMVRPASKALLLVERAYPEQAQCTSWELGYALGDPCYQMWGSPTYGLPLLHSVTRDLGSSVKKGIASSGKAIRFNYLFCDNHV